MSYALIPKPQTTRATPSSQSPSQPELHPHIKTPVTPELRPHIKTPVTPELRLQGDHTTSLKNVERLGRLERHATACNLSDCVIEKMQNSKVQAEGSPRTPKYHNAHLHLTLSDSLERQTSVHTFTMHNLRVLSLHCEKHAVETN
jgi:hypothetical protein